MKDKVNTERLKRLEEVRGAAYATYTESCKARKEICSNPDNSYDAYTAARKASESAFDAYIDACEDAYAAEITVKKIKNGISYAERLEIIVNKAWNDYLAARVSGRSDDYINGYRLIYIDAEKDAEMHLAGYLEDIRRIEETD